MTLCGPFTLEMICSDDVHCLSISILPSSYRGDVCYLVDKKMGKKVMNKILGSPLFQQKWWAVQFCCSPGTRFGPWKFSIILQDDTESFKACRFLNNQNVPSCTEWSVLQQAQVSYLVTDVLAKTTEVLLKLTRHLPPMVICLWPSERWQSMLSWYPTLTCREHVVVSSSVCDVPLEIKCSHIVSKLYHHVIAVIS
jgi:hypothetical protein